MMFKRRFLWIGGGCLVVALGLLAFRVKDKYFEIAKSLDLMAAVYRNLNSLYVDSLDPAELMQSGIDAMTQGLDPYTVFYPEAEADKLTFQTTGRYAGIGAAFRIINDSVFISALFPDAPFEQAGFRPGDVILSLNGVAATGLTSEEVHALLQGEANSKLNVVVKRPWNGQVIRKTVKRAMITIPSIPYTTILRDHIGYISFQQFTKGCAEEFKAAVAQLKKTDPELAGLIIDLRGNPGGLLGEAVKASNLFLPAGDTIVSVKGRIPSWNAVYTATEAPMDTVIPLAVLINGSTASAAEIFSGAMQDQDRGVIVGQQSFGKGLVQITRDLPYNAKLKFTVARYYTPSGRCIQAIDYRHDNAFGGPVRIADSLHHSFTTADGRVVTDKGGITPDQLVADTYLGGWASALMNDNVFFRFATRYRYSHAQPPPLEEFQVSDSLFDAFAAYVKKYPVAYGSRSEMVLESFRANAMSEGYFDSVQVMYDSLYSRIRHYTHPDLTRNKAEVSQLLAAEIMNCYYIQAGKIAVGVKADKVVEEAVSLLADEKSYTALLR